MEQNKSTQYEEVTFIRKEIRKVPTIVRFRRKDGSLAEIRTFKTIVIPKRVSFMRKKNDYSNKALS